LVPTPFVVNEGLRHSCQDIGNYPPEQMVRLCAIHAEIIVKGSWKMLSGNCPFILQ
jgi:hypothetical protein